MRYRLMVRLLKEWDNRLSGFLTTRMDRVVPYYIDDDLASDRQPVFIVGSGRSGTTLLRRILLAGGDVYIPPESYVIPQVLAVAQRNPGLSWSELVHLALSIYEYSEDFDIWGISLKPLKDRLLTVPKEHRSVARIISAIHLYHGEVMGYCVSKWGDKTPMYVFNLEDLYFLFPKGKFIGMVRDGVDVAVSMSRMGVSGRDLDYGAKRWIRSVRAFDTFASRNPLQCMELKYEELVSEPEKMVSEVCDFLSIEFDKKMVKSNVVPPGEQGRMHHENLKKRISDAQIGKGRRAIEDGVKGGLRVHLDKDLKLKGYDEV